MNSNTSHPQIHTLNRRHFLKGAIAISTMALPLFGRDSLAASSIARPKEIPKDYPGPSERFLNAITSVYQQEPISDGKVTLNMPVLAENGNSVLLSVHVESPMNKQQYVKRLRLFAENNPLPEVAAFQLTPHSGTAQISTRIRLSASQIITAIATLNDGSHWAGSAFTTITLPACVEAFV
ncbi:thiosulfate oxidation carrier protein SoxY [Marinibactrum halimedae]|uniref:Ig-like SoxY domain-containing protein n=1 Tax=Marinibactrum halimedae TaxID=1444977 RepID=A0AA37WR44_9GAMM|nr:thiosulfate oxidation carrier protein SoxY [Marinibactrum halimedae]MCD9460970.1 hypothetical protein [Marinibactrum halimedae]GLS28087.1 hypothetical protein GCM10007877_38060 [Marinibactrum halimedae]